MDTIGTETATATVELKEAFQVDAEQVKSFLEESYRPMNHVLDRFGNLALFLWKRGCHGEPSAE